MSHFTFSSSERRLLHKLTGGAPDKLPIVRGDKAFDPESKTWKEQEGKVVYKSREQLKEEFRAKLQTIFERNRKRDFAKNANDEWEQHAKYAYLHKYPPQPRGNKSRGQHLLDWNYRHSQMTHTKHEFISGQIARQEAQVAADGNNSFEDAMNTRFGENKEGKPLFDAALDEVVNGIMEDERFQRGVASFTEVSELAFKRFGEQLMDTDKLWASNDIPPEFKNLWKRGNDGKYALRAPGMYENGRLVKDSSDRYERFTGGRKDKNYLYQHEVDQLDPNEWKRLDETIDLRIRTSVDADGEKFGKRIADVIGYDVEKPKLAPFAHFREVKHESPAIPGRIFAFSIDKAADRKVPADELKTINKAGREGIVVVDTEGKILNAVHFEQVDRRMDFMKSDPEGQRFLRIFPRMGDAGAAFDEQQYVTDFKTNLAYRDAVQYADPKLKMVMDRYERLSKIDKTMEDVMTKNGLTKADIEGRAHFGLAPANRNALVDALAKLAKKTSPQTIGDIMRYFAVELGTVGEAEMGPPKGVGTLVHEKYRML
ncbi:MAG: hypothetical protein PHH13_02375 [Candidatus Peribacteraceae bacterium]|nr:hypothetical protein [Candidatus Peribacteraceae bacterium]